MHDCAFSVPFKNAASSAVMSSFFILGIACMARFAASRSSAPITRDTLHVVFPWVEFTPRLAEAY